MMIPADDLDNPFRFDIGTAGPEDVISMSVSNMSAAPVRFLATLMGSPILPA